MALIAIEHEPPAAPVTVIMGRKDASVPFDLVESTWKRWERSGGLAQGSRFVEVPEGDHRLVEFSALIADEIRRAAGLG